MYYTYQKVLLLTGILPKGGTFSQPWFLRIAWNSQIWNYYGRDDIWPNRKFLSSFIWILLHIEPKMPFKIYFFQINNLHSKSQPEIVIFLGHLSMMLNCISNTILCFPYIFIVCKQFLSIIYKMSILKTWGTDFEDIFYRWITFWVLGMKISKSIHNVRGRC